MTTWHEEQLLIDGELVPAANRATYENVNPATEEVLGVAADANVDDAQRAIGAARRAFDTTTWSRDPAFRQKCLRQLYTALRSTRGSTRITTSWRRATRRREPSTSRWRRCNG